MAFGESRIDCAGCGASFPIAARRPVLIRAGNGLFPPASYGNGTAKDAGVAPGRLARLLPARSVNMAAGRTLRAFAAALPQDRPVAVLVIGAGAQKEWLEGFFASRRDVTLVYSDVDVHATVDLFCDAHDLPFQDGVFDGVVASAVLEHVLYPERVVEEIHRVLSDGGLLYSEIPFLQQVHEGAYDFTRYTLSGHRRLLHRFRETASGAVAGPATTLAWALEHFAVSLAPHPRLRAPVKAGTRILFCWLPYVDYLLGQSAAATDGASCTYFFGAKSDATVTDREIVDRYAGVRDYRHV